MKNLLSVLILLLFYPVAQAQISWTATFESHPLAQADTFYNGSDSAGMILSGKAIFRNNYNASWNAWDGVSVSNMTDTTTKGYGNQYSVISGSGVNYSNTYAVAHRQAIVVLEEQQVVKGMYVNNGTYTALSMRDGDQFAKKFGGDDGNDKDYLRIIATGYVGGNTTGTETFYLADYRDSDNSKDYIVTDWKHWNLERLGDVDSIRFNFESSDTGQHGINTPLYFCFDNFNSDSLRNTFEISDVDFDYQTAVDSFLNGSNHDGGFKYKTLLFENNYNKQWKSWTGWSISSMTDTVDATFNNQYSCISGGGMGKSKTYITGYSSASILFPYVPEAHLGWTASRAAYFGINNATYPYKVMQEGNGFAKKFGGTSGNDKDFLVVNVVATMHSGEKSDTLSHYLADFRFDDNSMDYIQKDWDFWDLSQIIVGQPVVRLDFWVEGSDTGQYGLNTPAYFCLDNLFPVFGSVNETKELDFTVFPNPSTGVLNVKTKGVINEIRILDLLGKTKRFKSISDNQIDISNLETGIYFIQVQTNEGLVTKQFIKQ